MPHFNYKERAILQCLNATRVGITIFEISKETGISWPTIKKYIKKLKEKNIVLEKKDSSHLKYLINFELIYNDKKQ